MLDLAAINLTSPIVLFFALGLLIKIAKAKVEFPGAISDFISIYLLTAIGFKGGIAITQIGLQSIWLPVLGAVFLGVIIPFYSFVILRRLGKFNSDDSAAIAGHYGSISIVTFMAGSTFLVNLQVPFEGYINCLPAVMEVPGIVAALILAYWVNQKGLYDSVKQKNTLGQVTKQVVLSKSVVLLLGAMVVGYIAGPRGMDTVEVFYKDIFNGMLSLFMLELGMIAAAKLGEFKKMGLFLMLFGIIVPLINALLGILVGVLIGFGLGEVTLVAILAASSSYIVAPAAMRVSLPKANPAMYLGASIGITLPFNLVVGIPVYYYMAGYFFNKMTA